MYFSTLELSLYQEMYSCGFFRCLFEKRNDCVKIHAPAARAVRERMHAHIYHILYELKNVYVLKTAKRFFLFIIDNWKCLFPRQAIYITAIAVLFDNVSFQCLIFFQSNVHPLLIFLIYSPQNEDVDYYYDWHFGLLVFWPFSIWMLV